MVRRTWAATGHSGSRWLLTDPRDRTASARSPCRGPASSRRTLGPPSWTKAQARGAARTRLRRFGVTADLQIPRAKIQV